MSHARTPLPVALILVLLAAASSGCHLPHECPILQAMTFGSIPAPLPPKGDTYDVVGYRNGIRFYVVRYNGKLYRGGDITSAKGATALTQLGVKTVVSVTPNDRERRLAKEHGLALVEIPFGFNSLKKQHLDQFLRAVDGSPGPLYVHCFGGQVRGGILLAHYRIHREGWSAERAIKEYRRLGANYWDSLALVEVIKRNAPGS